MNASAGGAPIVVIDDGSKESITLEVSEALRAAILRTTLLAKDDEGFQLNFGSLFLGILGGKDPVAESLRRFMNAKRLESLLSLKKISRRAFDAMRRARIEPVEDPIRRTRSARTALDEAERKARDQGRPPDTRDVIAAYISMPTYHPEDFRHTGMKRTEWAKQFADDMEKAYPGEGWLEFPETVFPSEEAGQTTPGSSPSGTSPAPASGGVTLSATGTVAATGTASGSSSTAAAGTTQAINLSRGGIAKQALDALCLASALADKDTVRPSHVVRAIVSLGGSEAFDELARWVPLAKSPVPPSMPQLDLERLDSALLAQLIRAQAPLQGKTTLTEIWGRDLVTAALLASDESAAALAEAKRTLAEMRDRWFGFVTSTTDHRTMEQWHAWWNEAGVPLPPEPRSGMALESARGVDQLGVKEEARSFARLILDRKVEAPLSIGLLGDWGSGKSFFIGQVRDQIQILKEEKSAGFYHYPIEIEFNAWQASDTNLWASLVTHIFDGIWNQVAPKNEPTPEELERARKELMAQMGAAEGAVHEAEAQVDLGKRAVEAAEEELTEKRKQLSWENAAKTVTKAQLEKLAAEVGWNRSLDTIADVEEAARALNGSGQRLSSTVKSLFENPGTMIAIPTLCFAVVAGLAWLLLHQGTAIQEFGRWTAAAAGAVGAVVTPLKMASGKLDELTKKLAMVREEYFRPKDDKEKAAVEKQRHELQVAEERATRAKEQLAQLEAQYAAIEPRRRLGTFLQDRVQSTEYRAQQGIISLVHRDFKKLSAYMKDLRDARDPEKVEGPIGPLPTAYFDRIILYVDDLDRCRPKQVVHMLEAIHLLLALDLFIVVLAVDSRWLLRALEAHYEDLLGKGKEKAADERVSTPQNYLEKIFQITYALGPMDPKYFKNYVKSLAGGPTAAAKPETKAKMETKPESRSTGIKPKTETKPETETKPTTESKPDADPDLPLSDAKVETKEEPTIPVVEIDEREQKLIEDLVPLLPTPRIAKRLVNVYRLIKAAQEAGEQQAFCRKSGDACLLLLAIVFGRPLVAAELLRSIHEKKEGWKDPKRKLVDAVKARTAPTDEPKHITDEWTRLGETLETMSAVVTVAQCEHVPAIVARYSLVTGHDWHTWKRMPS